jgi:hypothetical protein
MVDTARCRIDSFTSTSETSKPLAAAVWAMPLPIVPPPITTMFFIRLRSSRVKIGQTLSHLA